MEQLVQVCLPQIQETLPSEVLEQYQLIGKQESIRQIHFPSQPDLLQRARKRLKFEEFFFVQLRLLKLKLTRIEKSRGQPLSRRSY